MEKAFKLLVLTTLLSFSIGCVADGNDFQNSYNILVDPSEGTAEGNKELERLTRGRTFPTAQDLTYTVSNPGNISAEEGCVEFAATDDTDNMKMTVSTKGRSPFIKNVAPDGKDPKYGVSLKNHPRPERGCYPVANVSLDQAKKAIASQNFSYGPDREVAGSKPSSAELRTFGAAVLSMQYLNGGVFQIGRPAKSFPFEYCDHTGKSSQQFGNRIRISRKGNAQNGLSVAQYVHEWGHMIGNAQMPGSGGNVYQEFLKAIGGKVSTEDSSSGQAPCLVSRYADNRSNEHFAELLTAFVTEPSILLNNTSKGAKACKKAYDFFEKRLFKNGSRARECM